MANGKITWAAPPFKAIIFDGAHYLSLASADFDMGTGDFALDFLFYPDSTQADTEGLVCGKGAASLTNTAGWQIFSDQTSKRLVLKINDGNAAVLTVYSSNDAFAPNIFSHGRVELDRDGQASFFVNNVAVGTGSIAARPGSLNNSELFKVGGLDAATNRFKGSLGLLRMDKGRLLPAAWYAREWERLRYGLLPRSGLDFLERWNFGETLLGEQGYTLTWQGGGAPAYTTGYPSGTISYTLEENYNFGHRAPYLEGPGLIRMLDGSAASYNPGWHKRRLLWEFDNISPGQVTALMAADQARTPVTFYPDAALPPLFTGLFVPGMEFEETFLNLWSGDIEAEQN